MVKEKKKSFILGLLGAATAAGMVMGATGVISTFVEKPAEANAAAGDKYVRLNEMPEEGLSGEYLIVCEEKGLVFNGALDPIDVEPNYLTFTTAAGQLDWSSTYAAAAFNIQPYDGGYSIQTSNGDYVYFKGSSNGIYTDSAPHANSITFSGANAVITNGGRTLIYNSSSNRFRYFESTTSTYSKKVQLYKLEHQEVELDPTISIETSAISMVTEESTSVAITYKDITDPLEVMSSDPGKVEAVFDFDGDITGSGTANLEITAKAATTEPVTLTISSGDVASASIEVTITQSDTYYKIAKASDIVDGIDVVMGFETGEVISSYDSSKDRYPVSEGAFVDDNLATDAAYTFKLEAHSQGYTIFDNAEGKYLGVHIKSSGEVQTGAVDLSSELSEDYYWDISVAADGMMTMTPISTKGMDDSYNFARNSTTKYAYAAVYKGAKKPYLYAKELHSVTDEQRLATFGKLYLRADKELSGEDTGACVDDGYYARAKAALEGDWADVLPLLEADTTGLKDRYMAWAIANGELADLSGSKATYYTLNPNASFSKKVTTAALSGLGVLTVGAAAAGVMIAIRKKKHE